MFNPSDFDLLELYRIIDSYDYESDALLNTHFHQIEEALCADIENYGAGVNNYGEVMMAHFRRRYEDCRDYLVYALGFTD